MSTHEGNSAVADDGFVPFFRRYTKTWVHAVATAGLTAFGTLTFVNRWFVVLALGSYVVPPVALYLSGGVGGTRGDRAPDRAGGERSHGERTRDRDREERPLEADAAGASETRSRRTEGSSTGDAEPGVETTASVGSRTAAEAPASADAPSSDEPPARADERNEDGGRPERDEDADRDARGEWRPVDVPATGTLFDAVATEAGDAYAVGGGGLVVADRGQGWTTVLEDGPAARGNDLRGADATADGAAVWVAGDSGAVGRIDAETGRHTDHTAPADRTDNLLGVAVGGPAGGETVLLVTGSGEVLRGQYADGSPGEDEGPVEWDEPIKPGSGSSLAGVALADEAVGYCCDTNDGVFETDDGGQSFERVGPAGADGTLEAVATAGPDDCLVSADDGVVHRYGASGTWTPERVADAALPGLARRGDRTVACAADGAIHERTAESASWERLETDADAALLAVSIGPDRAVAVGEAGTVLERRS
ncbi:WD40/YVTN/BNR-like repeat-containing protein [Halopiger thermotolerans]